MKRPAAALSIDTEHEEVQQVLKRPAGARVYMGRNACTPFDEEVGIALPSLARPTACLRGRTRPHARARSLLRSLARPSSRPSARALEQTLARSLARPASRTPVRPSACTRARSRSKWFACQSTRSIYRSLAWPRARIHYIHAYMFQNCNIR